MYGTREGGVEWYRLRRKNQGAWREAGGRAWKGDGMGRGRHGRKGVGWLYIMEGYSVVGGREWCTWLVFPSGSSLPPLLYNLPYTCPGA